uniref:ABC transporter permease n=1 Tax=Streptomyces halstedii TaxID=1944 RepID=UPI001E5A7EED|nr:ABC transporter permease [Streptomyces halstedii]
MSTLAPPRPSPSPSPTGLRGPARVVVRQHRLVLWITGGLAVAMVLTLVATALWSSHVVDAFASGPCTAEGDPGRGCYQPVRNYLDSALKFSRVFDYAALVLAALPVFVGAFVAGPMIARELETGTFKVSWTQSVPPARWLAAKLAVPAVPLLAGVAVLTAVLAWARSYADTPYPAQWYAPTLFGASGITPLAHTLVALSVGALVGLLVRRTVAATGVAALSTGAVIVALAAVRPGLWPLRTVTSESGGIPDDSWILEYGRITDTGERLSIDICGQPVSEHPACLAGKTVVGEYFDHHPASHFWPLQLVETGILLVLAALALTLAFRVLRRRHG